MDNSLHVSFGTPIHGWLPVDLKYQKFHLEFEASDVLNDPLDELFNILIIQQHYKSEQVTWWLEPGAYFFEFEWNEDAITLIISETHDLHDDKVERIVIQIITGERKQIIEPFRNALIQFCSQTIEESHWASNMDKSKIEKLSADK